MVSIKLPDGSVREYPDNTNSKAVAESIGKGLAKAAVAARVDGQIVDLAREIAPGQHDFAVLTDRDPDALQVLRHSTAHVMAEAIQRIWPNALLAYGPAVENGFYYDIALENPISSSDFEKIEKEMAQIVSEDRAFNRYELPFDAGLDRLKKEGNKYKIDNAQRAEARGSGRLSWYVTGEKDKNWEDLCMGPHVPSTGRIKAFKVMNV